MKRGLLAWIVGWIAAGLLMTVGGAAGAEEKPSLRVATFSCDVTPPLDGQPIIWVTPLKSVEDPLLAKGIVLDDGHERYVLCAVDWCGLCNSSHLLFRRKLAAAVGTDVSRVAVHTVHQHTAPYVDGDAQKLLDKTEKAPRYVDFQFLDRVTDQLAAAAKKSLASLQPIDRIGTGLARVDRVASSRRITTADGKLHVRMSSAKEAALRALPEGFIDPVLRTITLAQGEKPLVRLHFYATHPQSFYGDARASADVPGIARERLQKKDLAFQVYFTGCCGDIAMGKYNDGSRAARDELVERLLTGMEASLAATRWAPLDQVQWRTLPLVLPLADDAEKVRAEQRAKLADAKSADIPRVSAATRVAFIQRAKEPLQLNLVKLGPVQLLLLPGECMLEFQRFAQQVNRDSFLAVAAYGDLGTGYICTEKSFAEGGYEPTASRVGPKSEGVLKEAIQELLRGK